MIKTDNLTKRYGDLTAVDHLSFTVEPGEVLGFLGPNGAGKSTTMKMLTGFAATTLPGTRYRPRNGSDTCRRALPATAK